MFEKKSDGTYKFSTRFWVYTCIATVIICWIGWKTQQTSDRVEHTVQSNSQFAQQTNDCLADLISVLTTRVGYNEEIAKLDARRQNIWEKLVTDLSQSNNNDGLELNALNEFFEANDEIKADQAKIAEKREENQYPDCAQIGPTE